MMLTNNDLMQGLALQRAQNSEFVKAWVVYRGVNEDFAQSFADAQSELVGVDCCFWIESNKRRVGGVIMLPNRIGDFFLIPPAGDASKTLSSVMPLLDHWSAPDQEIHAQAISAPYVGAFQQAGFHLQESRVWMIRPTESLTAGWPAEWEIASLESGQAQAIASLLKEAFTGGVGDYGARGLDAHLASVEGFFEGYVADADCGQASAKVVEKASGTLAGVCMMEMHKGLPTIRFVAVAPTYQRRGLATRLLRYAINTLAPTHDWVKLAVTEGNPAMALYRNLGFVAGDTLHQLSKPPLQ